MEIVLWVFRVGQIPVRFVRFVYLFIFLRLVSNSDFNEKLRRLLFFPSNLLFLVGFQIKLDILTKFFREQDAHDMQDIGRLGSYPSCPVQSKD